MSKKICFFLVFACVLVNIKADDVNSSGFLNGILDEVSNMFSGHEGKHNSSSGVDSSDSDGGADSTGSGIGDSVSNTINNISNGLQNTVSNIGNSILSLVDTSSVITGKMATSNSVDTSEYMSSISGTVSSIVENVQSTLSETVTDLAEGGVEIAYKGNTITAEDLEISNLKSALSEQVSLLKDSLGEKLVGAISKIDTGGSELLSTLKNSLNGCILSFTSDGPTAAINSIAQEFVSFSNNVVDAGVNATAGEVAAVISSAEELKSKAQAMLEEKIALMTSIGMSEEDIQKVKKMYEDTVGNTLANVAIGDFAKATADLTAKKEELAEHLGGSFKELANSLETAKSNLTEQLLEATHLNETAVGKAVSDIAGSLNVGSMAEKLMNGDTESLKEELGNAMEQVKAAAAEKVEGITASLNENLTNKLLSATGMQNNATVSSMVSSAVSSLNLGGIASSLFSGGISGLKDTVGQVVGGVKEALNKDNIQDKVSGVVSDLVEDNNAVQKLQDSIKNFGDSVKTSISNTTLGMTSAGSALNDIVDAAVKSGNEGAIAAVNQILQGDVQSGINALKESGLEAIDNSISSSIKIAESLVSQGFDKVSEKISDYGVSVSYDPNSTQTQESSEVDLSSFVNSENDVIDEEAERKAAEIEKESEMYTLHEGNIHPEGTSHHEGAVHNSKTTSTSSNSSD